MECELTRDPCISERLTCKSSIQAPASVAAPPGQQLFTTADVCFSHHTLWEETAAIVQTRSLNGHQGVFAGNPSWFLIFTIQLHLQVVFVKCLMVKRWEGMQGMRVAAEPPFRTSLCYRVHHDTEWHCVAPPPVFLMLRHLSTITISCTGGGSCTIFPFSLVKPQCFAQYLVILRSSTLSPSHRFICWPDYTDHVYKVVQLDGKQRRLSNQSLKFSCKRALDIM